MQRIYAAAIGTAFAIVILNGCVGEDSGSTPTTPPEADGSTDATATDAGSTTDGAVPDLDPDAAPPALCPLGCLPPAPKDWTGPSAVYDGTADAKPAECPTPYTLAEVEAHVGMTAAPATCGCGTAVVTGRKCTSTVVTYSNNGCSLGALAEPSASTTGCTETFTGTNGFYKVAAPTLSPGTCTYPTPTKDVPPVAYAKVQAACGLPQAATCESRADCVASPTPPSPFNRLCIHRDGDLSCPSADYAVKILAHKTVDDTRSCSACGDTAPTGGACGAAWGEAASQGACMTTTFPSNKTFETCYSYGGVGTLVDIRAAAPSAGTCTPSGGMPINTATSADPVTFCCNR